MSLKAYKTPWKIRPIVYCAGTLMNYVSRWLDHQFQKLKPLIATYIRTATTCWTCCARLDHSRRTPDFSSLMRTRCTQTSTLPTQSKSLARGWTTLTS
ncbi:hypothetical protein ACHAWF_010288 [Thalassiosira exigua]